METVEQQQYDSRHEQNEAVSAETSVQLQLYQAVPLNLDNLYPYTRNLPTHIIPSLHQAEPNRRAYSAQERLTVHLEGKVKSSLYTLKSQPDTCIQWRLLSDRKTLELRALRWINSTATHGSTAIAEESELDKYDSDSTLSVVSSWIFAAPLLDQVLIVDRITPEGDLQILVTVCSADGVMYRLDFPSVSAIASESRDVRLFTSWYQIARCYDADDKSTSNKFPRILSMAGDNMMVIGCNDGALVWLRLREMPEGVHGDLRPFITETVSSAAGLLKSVKDFFPRMLRRGVAGGSNSSYIESEDISSQPISCSATQVLEGSAQYAVTLSRDRKVQFWSNGWGSGLQHEEMLPQLDPQGMPIPLDPHGPQPPLLDSETHSYVRMIENSTQLYAGDTEMETGRSNAFGVLVFVPDEATPYFVMFQVSINSQAKINSVKTIMYKVCRATNGASQMMAGDDLVDFQIAYNEETVGEIDIDANGVPEEVEATRPYWTLWALWDRAGEAVVTYTYFSLRPDIASEDEPVFEFDGHPTLGERWYTVLAQQHAARPTNDCPRIKAIEARLSKDSNDDEVDVQDQADSSDYPELDQEIEPVQASTIADVFLDHLFNSSRFDRSVLEHALYLYEASAHERGFDLNPALHNASSASVHLRQSVAETVGSFLRVETSRKDGSALITEYHRTLFTEWMRYSTLCARLQRANNTPCSLALCASISMVCIVRANGLAMLQAAGEIEWMHALTERDSAASVLLNAPESLIAATYPTLAQGNARVEVARILAATTYISKRLPADRLADLTDSLMIEASSEMLVSHEAKALELFDNYIAESITLRNVKHAAFLLRACRCPTETIHNLLQALVQSVDIAAPLTEQEMPDSLKSSATMDGLFVSSFSISIQARFEIARDIALLLICLTSYHDKLVQHSVVTQMPRLLAASTRTFGLFAIAHWTASQAVNTMSGESVGEDGSAVDGFLRKFSILNLSRGNSTGDSVNSSAVVTARSQIGNGAQASFIYSLLHHIISLNYPLRFTGHSGMFADMLREGMLQVFSHLGFITWGDFSTPELQTSTQVALIQLGARIERSAPPELASSFLLFLPKSTAHSYLDGLVALRMLDYTAAAEFFGHASVAYSQISEDVKRNVDLQHVLPKHVLDKGFASAYYQYIADMFESVKQFEAASRFYHLSMLAMNEENEYQEEKTEATQAELKIMKQKTWFKVFHAEVELGRFEEAYMAMMANPDKQLQLDCLRHLTGILCERDGGVAILCKLGFPGLQEEVGRSLIFKARNSDPIGKPNYYKISYAFNIYRGNYRDAALAMYQYSRRLGSLMLYHNSSASEGSDNDTFAQLLEEQSQALLASINGLQLVDKQYAWVIVQRQPGITTLTDASLNSDAHNTKRKRRRIQIGRYNPASSSSQDQDLDIVELADIRREYLLNKSRIALGTSAFPELFSKSIVLDPEDSVSLYVKAGMYDNAVAFAKAFEIPLTNILSTLTWKCIELSATKDVDAQRDQIQDAFWENHAVTQSTGTPAERCWNLLQYYLRTEEPDTKTTYGGQQDARLKYHLSVAEVILKSDYDSALVSLPPWLATPLVRRAPQDLVRLCLRNGCISEGAEFLISHINAERNRILHADTAVQTKTACGFWLPYQLVDQTLTILDDAVERFDTALAKLREAKECVTEKGSVSRLRAMFRSYAERLETLERLRKDLNGALEKYLVYADRESRDIATESLSTVPSAVALETKV